MVYVLKMYLLSCTSTNLVLFLEKYYVALDKISRDFCRLYFKHGGGDYAMLAVCLFVCSLICEQDSIQQLWMDFGELCWLGSYQVNEDTSTSCW